eukprot:GILK01002624.1.p1 GENE.GILK01002624.1~~GILK01002624.1.p1  ORF type:complete len:467 (-),score=88.93 GILK01002624.1:77-1432(-)
MTDKEAEHKEYLRQQGVDVLLEYLVGDLLLDRPADVVEYLIDKLQQKKSGAAVPVGSDTSGLLTIPTNPRRSSTFALLDLERLLTSVKVIGAATDPWEASRRIISETCSILNCDRATLFVYNPKTDSLNLSVAKGAESIQVKPGAGIAGHVFSSGESLNVHNAYEDARFDSKFDQATGYKTRNVLAVPVVDNNGYNVGVLQAVNKHDGNFSKRDEVLINHLASSAGVTLRNSEVYQAAVVSEARAQGLLKLVRSMSQDLGVQSLLLAITHHATELVQADRCTVFVVDARRDALISISTDSGAEIRIPRTGGICGHVASTGEPTNIADAYEDSRFNQDFDRKTGYRTKSVLAMPIVDTHGNIIGVVQLINKRVIGQPKTYTEFDEDDEEVMTTFCDIIGPKLQNAFSSIIGVEKAPVAEAARAFQDASHGRQERRKSLQGTIEEDDEDQDEA